MCIGRECGGSLRSLEVKSSKSVCPLVFSPAAIGMLGSAFPRLEVGWDWDEAGVLGLGLELEVCWAKLDRQGLTHAGRLGLGLGRDHFGCQLQGKG